MLLEKVRDTLVEKRLVPRGGRLLVAVSGGADSIALLHLLAQLAPVDPFDLHVAHLDHCLRPESAADGDFVEAVCCRLKVPLTRSAVDVATEAQRLKVGLEEAGRQVRRTFLEGVATQEGCSVIALAHHADDQAETVLFRLLRGTGISGLAAMQFSSPPYIRPLLECSRSELRDYLLEQKIAWREDASNASLDFSRNLIRHRLLPELQQVNAGVRDALLRLSRQATDEELFWQQRSDDFLQAHGRLGGDGYELVVEPLLACGKGERRRHLRAFFRQVSAALSAVDVEHIDAVERMLCSSRPQGDLDLPGFWVGRRYDKLLCSRSAPVYEPYEIVIDGPGDYLLPAGGRLRVVVSSGGAELEGECFDADLVPFPLTVRSPQPGDRFSPAGMEGSKRLKDFFIDAKISREERWRTPVVCFGENIILLAGRRRSRLFEPSVGGRALSIAYFKGDKRSE